MQRIPKDSAEMSEEERMIRDLFFSVVLSRSLLTRVSKSPSRQALGGILDTWAKENDYTLDWNLAVGTWDSLTQNYLFPWNGFYLYKDPDNSKNDLLILILASSDPKKGASVSTFKLFNDCDTMDTSNKIYYQDNTLKWALFRSPGASKYKAYFQTQLGKKGHRHLFGYTWDGSQTQPESDSTKINLEEITPSGPTLTQLSGVYQYVGESKSETPKRFSIFPTASETGQRVFQFQKDEEDPFQEADVGYKYRPRRIVIRGEEYLLEKINDQPGYWVGEQKLSPWLFQTYIMNIKDLSAPYNQVVLIPKEDDTVDLLAPYNSSADIVFQKHNWLQIRNDDLSANLTFFIEPITMQPGFYGSVFYKGTKYPCHGVAPYEEWNGKLSEEPLYEIPKELWRYLLAHCRQQSDYAGNALLSQHWLSSRLAHKAMFTIEKTLLDSE